MAGFACDEIKQFIAHRMCFGVRTGLVNVTGSISFADVVRESMGVHTKRFVGTKSGNMPTQFHVASWFSCTFHQIANAASGC